MESWIVIMLWASRLVLIGLICLSVWSVTIILNRRRYFKALSQQPGSATIIDWVRAGEKEKVIKWANSSTDIRAGVVKATLARNEQNQMEKSYQSFLGQERFTFEKNLPILGTLGSTTPFIGLLGTIFGITVAFGNLSSGQVDPQKMMLSLAEALVSTAVGLFVAIPAVMAFNFFAKKVSNLIQDCESLKDALVSYFGEA